MGDIGVELAGESMIAAAKSNLEELFGEPRHFMIGFMGDESWLYQSDEYGMVQLEQGDGSMHLVMPFMLEIPDIAILRKMTSFISWKIEQEALHGEEEIDKGKTLKMNLIHGYGVQFAVIIDDSSEIISPDGLKKAVDELREFKLRKEGYVKGLLDAWAHDRAMVDGRPGNYL